MATTFKTLTANDITNTRTLLHEAIPLTGTIASGTYSDENIKTFSHGMFESVFDYPFLSSSANHVFDITHGYSNNSNLSGTTAHTQNAKKINIYNQMAAVLVGHDATGSIQLFDKDGDIAGGGAKMEEVFFINFSRLLSKDEIKKDSFRLTFATGSQAGNLKNLNITLGDYGAASSYLVNSPAGEYGLLYTSLPLIPYRQLDMFTTKQVSQLLALLFLWEQPVRNTPPKLVLNHSQILDLASPRHLIKILPLDQAFRYYQIQFETEL